MTEEITTTLNRKITRVVRTQNYTSVSTIVSVHIPVQLLQRIDELIQKGYFQNRSDALREAIRRLVRDYEVEKYNFTVGYR